MDFFFKKEHFIIVVSAFKKPVMKTRTRAKGF